MTLRDLSVTAAVATATTMALLAGGWFALELARARAEEARWRAGMKSMAATIGGK